MIKAGRETTEHSRAWRGEVAGVVLLALGIVLAFRGSWFGVAFAAIGAALLAAVDAAYFFSRGGVKSAAARPAPVHPHPRIG